MLRWLTVRFDADERVGVLKEDVLYMLPKGDTLLGLLRAGQNGLREAGGRALAGRECCSVSDAELMAPIPVPPSIRDFLSFEEHLRNSRKARNREVPELWYKQPCFYFSNPAAVCSPSQDIRIPPGCRQFDYELEIAAIIGQGGSNLTVDEAEECIAGYTILCDWSARDLQFRESEFGLGPAKGKDSATSLGPWLVTTDELAEKRLGRGYDLKMVANVNGRTYTTGNFSSIYWSFAEMLAYASMGTELRPGDVIGSGTVGRGCILELSGLEGSERYPWLQPGDELVLEVEMLGALSHRITAGPPPAWDPISRQVEGTI